MTVFDAVEVIVDLLQRGHAVEFRARGDSMYPVIREDDLLHVEPSLEFKRGEVVLTIADRGLTAHRVIAVDSTTITTRGDNTPSADDALPLARAVGKVTWVERNGKRRGVRREFVLLRVLRRLRRL